MQAADGRAGWDDAGARPIERRTWRRSRAGLSSQQPGVRDLHLWLDRAPEGTAMAHRSMVNLIEWHRRQLQLAQGQRVLQFAALSFDVAFQEIFSTLCTGGTLVLLDEWMRQDARALLELLSERSDREAVRAAADVAEPGGVRRADAERAAERCAM